MIVTNSPTKPVAPLSESELAEIEARRPGTMNVVTVERILLTPSERDALCQTVRAAWQRIAELTTQWCQCGHAKDKHASFGDHDECYECDQASDDLCCEWRPAQRPEERDEITALRERLAQVEKERLALTEEEFRLLADHHYLAAERAITRRGDHAGQQQHLERLAVIRATKEQP